MPEYSIHEISERFHLPPSTLRYYEEEGLLTDVGRTPSGQRVYFDMHVNRLRTICCFKKTGMTIAQLKTFFACESAGAERIDDILALLRGQADSVEEQLRQLQEAHDHVLRKLRYYGDIKASLDAGSPLPDWKDYKTLKIREP